MKLAITITDITGDGGTERTSILLANTFSQRGHDVTIISLFKKNPNICFPIIPEVKIVFLCENSYDLSRTKFERLKLILSARKLLRNELRRNRYDEIISQAFLPTFIFFTIGYVKKITACEHFKYELYSSIGITVRNSVYKKCKRVITLTKKDSEKFLNAGVKNSVIPNMVTFPIGENVGQDEKKIVAAGRLSQQKGFDLLIKAMVPVLKKYPDWHLEIYGKGECERELKNLANHLEISTNIYFKGFCANLSQVFRESTFYVLSSRFEGFPMILLEAASQKLPCISFDCPEGPSEILRGKGGLLVDPENIPELSSAIIRFIEDENLRMNCAERALKNIEDYTPNNIYIKWLNTFNNE